MPSNKDYNAKDIEVLEGLEPVRKRPGMYIGGTDTNALHHLLNEILDNSMDEAIAGFADVISVNLISNGTISVEDNGRGIPVDTHAKYKKSALEIILTTLHSGGKFNNNVYKTSGGLHGVGLSIVNALSEKLLVEVTRDSNTWRQNYSKGVPLDELIFTPTKNKNGTKISFIPDRNIFSDITWHPDIIVERLKSKGFLFPGVKIKWNCNYLGKEESQVIHYPGGLSDFILSCIDSNNSELSSELGLLIKSQIFKGSLPLNSNETNNASKIEWAIFWPQVFDSSVLRELEEDNQVKFNTQTTSFCNTIPTAQGGSHLQGVKQAIIKAVRNFSNLLSIKKGATVTIEDCLQGAHVVISVFIPDPQFQGQTKDKLTNSSLTRLIENTLLPQLEHWFTQHKNFAESIINGAITSMDRRKRIKQIGEVSRQSYGKKMCLPGKLTDCSSNKKEDTEIFIVEGASAGGSARQARIRQIQAILPLRGKVLNVISASEDKFLQNQEIRNLITALGTGIGDQFKLDKLRYEKVIIMTDADVDGAHIASLLICFFLRCMPKLIEAGKLYLARPPLFRVLDKNKNFYAYDEKHKAVILNKCTKTAVVSRFKGLGEMMWQQLKETTMEPGKRTLYKLEMKSDEEDLKGADIDEITAFVNDLMGRNPSKRAEFIKKGAVTYNPTKK